MLGRIIRNTEFVLSCIDRCHVDDFRTCRRPTDDGESQDVVCDSDSDATCGRCQGISKANLDGVSHSCECEASLEECALGDVQTEASSRRCNGDSGGYGSETAWTCDLRERAKSRRCVSASP